MKRLEVGITKMKPGFILKKAGFLFGILLMRLQNEENKIRTIRFQNSVQLKSFADFLNLKHKRNLNKNLIYAITR